MSENTSANVSPKSFWLVFNCAVLLGIFGVHRFVVGRWKSAILQLFTFGGLTIWAWIDIFTILLGKFKDSNGFVIPNTGKKLSWALTVIVLLGWLYRVSHSENSGNTQSSEVSGHQPTAQGSQVSLPPDRQPTAQASQVSVPSEQKAFTDAVTSFISQYQSAPNELKKSAVRFSRKQKLQELLTSLDFNGWVGRIDKMGTTSKGNAYISVTLDGTSIVTETYNNELSDIGDNTLIPINSELFNKVSDLKSGDQVKVSGHFLTEEQDFIKENSITEDGSMTEPEFIVQFSQVGKP